MHVRQVKIDNVHEHRTAKRRKAEMAAEYCCARTSGALSTFVYCNIMLAPAAIACRTKMAIIGEISMFPMGGIILRKGAIIG